MSKGNRTLEKDRKTTTVKKRTKKKGIKRWKSKGEKKKVNYTLSKANSFTNSRRLLNSAEENDDASRRTKVHRERTMRNGIVYVQRKI